MNSPLKTSDAIAAVLEALFASACVAVTAGGFVDDAYKNEVFVVVGPLMATVFLLGLNRRPPAAMRVALPIFAVAAMGWVLWLAVIVVTREPKDRMFYVAGTVVSSMLVAYAAWKVRRSTAKPKEIGINP
jgi:hypothetical protein